MPGHTLTEIIRLNRAGSGMRRAPSLHRKVPEPEAGLLLRVDLGWVSPGARFLLVVGPKHTFGDLARAILSVARFDDDCHFSRFHLNEGDATRSFWREGPCGARAAQTSSRRVDFYSGGIEQMWSSLDAAAGDADAESITVASEIGQGWHLWYQFDFGDEWWWSIRALRSIPPVTTTDRILLVADATVQLEQYPLDEDEDTSEAHAAQEPPFDGAECDFALTHLNSKRRWGGDRKEADAAVLAVVRKAGQWAAKQEGAPTLTLKAYKRFLRATQPLEAAARVPSTLIYRFGSWQEVLEAAGLPVTDRHSAAAGASS